MGELRLMHHYCVSLSEQLALTSMDLQGTTKVWQQEIPRMAFQHNFLMHALLCISSHHTQTMLRLQGADASPQSRETDFYLDIALSGYRTAIANLTPGNIEAVIAASLIMVVLATRHHVMFVEGDLWVVSFLGLHAGMQSVQSVLGKEGLTQSSLWPLLAFDEKLAEDPTYIPQVFESMLSLPESASLPADQLQTLYASVQAVGKLYGLLESASSPQTRGQFFIKVMASGKMFPPSLVVLVRQRLPQAMVIMMHYLCFLKIPALHGYVTENITSDMNIAMNILQPRWMHYCETPRLIYSMQDPHEVLMQLMLQLPQGLTTMMNSAPMSSSYTSSPMGHLGGRIEELSDGSVTSERSSGTGSGLISPVTHVEGSPFYQSGGGKPSYQSEDRPNYQPGGTPRYQPGPMPTRQPPATPPYQPGGVITRQPGDAPPHQHGDTLNYQSESMPSQRRVSFDCSIVSAMPSS